MRGSRDFDGLYLKPPIGHKTVWLKYVNEQGSLVLAQAQLGFISVCGDSFTLKLHGKTTFDTVVAVRAHHGIPHHWALINRTNGKPDLVVKDVNWHVEYPVRFKNGSRRSPGQMSLSA